MKLRLTASENLEEFVASGSTFAHCASKLLDDLLAAYGDVEPSLFEALAELAMSEDAEPKYRSFDFSTPESAYTLELLRDDQPKQRKEIREWTETQPNP